MKKQSLNTKCLTCQVLLYFLLSVQVKGQIIVTGPQFPATVMEQNAGCLACPGASWMNPVNAMLADSQFAETQLWSYPLCFNGSCYYSRALMAEDFNFSIPSNASITGIKAEVRRKASKHLYISDTIVSLMDNGLPVGANVASLNTWDSIPQIQPYGDSTNLWGIAWTPAQVNATDFGLFFMPKNKDLSANSNSALVDYIRLTIFYENPTGIIESQVSDDPLIVAYDSRIASLLIRSNITITADAELHIYDMLGRDYFDEILKPGAGQLLQRKINTALFPSGIYFVELISANRQLIKKVRIDN